MRNAWFIYPASLVPRLLITHSTSSKARVVSLTTINRSRLPSAALFLLIIIRHKVLSACEV